MQLYSRIALQPLLPSLWSVSPHVPSPPASAYAAAAPWSKIAIILGYLHIHNEVIEHTSPW